MRKILIAIFLMNIQWLFAQEDVQKISMSFEGSEIIDVLVDIEKRTDYHFYFVEEWLKGKKISGTYKNVPLDEILHNILDQTLVNFYIMDDKRIILTRNSIIYDELPNSVFDILEDALTDTPETKTDTIEEIEDPSNGAGRISPIFRQGRTAEPTRLETVFIGKEDRTDTSKRYSISGIIKNTETGKPISNLAIAVRNTDIGAVTNERGYYELELPPGANILEINSLSYEDALKKVVVYNDGELNFDLRTDYEQLGEVLLETDADENVKRAVTGVSEINVEKIKLIPLVLGERDILKVAATLPGITRAGPAATGYNVRGGKADQNLILLDGAVIYNPFHFFGIFSALNPFTTGSVTIYKGSMPAKYGGRLSSVFDIRTKDANTTDFSGELSIGPVTGNLMLNIPIVEDKSGLLIGGRGTYSNWILQTIDKKAFEDSEAHFYDVIANYNHEFNESTNIKAMGYFSRDVFSISSDSLFSYNNRLFSLSLNHEFNKENKGSLILTNSNYKFNINYDNEFKNDFISGYTINESKIKADLYYQMNDKHTFNYGLSSKLYLIHPGNIQPDGPESIIRPRELPQEKGLESAAFISDKFEISDKLMLNAGFRYSYYASLGSAVKNMYEAGTPKNQTTITDTLSFGNNEVIETYGGPEFRLSARYFLMDNLSVKASYNTAYQYIHALTTNTTASPTDTYKLSGLNIEPQFARQYSLGLYQNLHNNMYELSLEGYFKRMENILDYKVGAQLFLNENLETEVLQGEGKAYGIEFLLKKTSGRLNGWLAYAYSRSFIKLDSEFPVETVNGGEYFPSNFDMPHKLSIIANYKVTKRFSFSANFVYKTGRPITYPIGKYSYNGNEYVLYSDRNKYRIPDYYRLDLSFNVEGTHLLDKIGHSFWNISVYNVLGRNNPYSIYFVSDNGEIQAYKSSIFSVPVPTITYNLKF